jgi:hypothetical protein
VSVKYFTLGTFFGQLAASAGNHRRRTSAAEPSFLAGLLVDAHGERLTPSHAVKKGRCYRYYISPRRVPEEAADPTQSWRLPAREIEDCVISIRLDALTNPARLLDRLDLPDLSSHQMRRLLAGAARFAATLGNSHRDRPKVIRGLVERVVLDEKRIVVAIRRSAFSDGDVPLRASDTSDSQPCRSRDRTPHLRALPGIRLGAPGQRRGGPAWIADTA